MNASTSNDAASAVAHAGAPMSVVFIGWLSVWALLSVFRFVQMYDPASPFQRWRRFDVLRLVPVGAFFAPEPPSVEYWLLVRNVLENGQTTAWTELPRLRGRQPWNVVWNPEKHSAKIRTALARRLICAAARLGHEGFGQLPPQLLLSAEYLSVLRCVSDLPRLAAPRATQFAVLETHVMTKSMNRCVLSELHEL